MPLPDPIPGLVLHYSYLWFDQHRLGMLEGTKDRPCVGVLAASQDQGNTIVTVVPITHTPPRIAAEGVEIPPDTKRRLGLDDARSWVIATEVNGFTWPGPDLRPIPGMSPTAYAYGMLPPGLFRQIRTRLIAWAESLKTAARD